MTPYDKLKQNIGAVHGQLDADLASGDPKAKAFASTLHGELNAARKSLGIRPLPATDDVWIGSKFRAPTNGVLILGESTYGEGPPFSEYVPKCCRGEQRDQTFILIFNSCSDVDPSSATPSDREAFWATIAFDNFVQESVGPKREDKPSQDHYRSAAVTLLARLQRLKPRGVLVLGKCQAKFSEAPLQDSGIPYVICRHPTAYGVRTSELKAAWNELQSKMRSQEA
jgi:hypothetical protein